MNEENTWCGEDKPPLIRASNAVEIIFRTDNYLARSGFEFKYFLHGTRQNDIIIIYIYIFRINAIYSFLLRFERMRGIVDNARRD